MSTVAPVAFLITEPTPPVISSRAVPAADSTATAVCATTSVATSVATVVVCVRAATTVSVTIRANAASVAAAPLSWPPLRWASS